MTLFLLYQIPKLLPLLINFGSLLESLFDAYVDESVQDSLLIALCKINN